MDDKLISILDVVGHRVIFLNQVKGIANILSLSLAQKNNPVTYNTRYGYKFLIYIPQRPPFNMTKAGLFYRDMRHLLNNKDAHIIVSNLHSPIQQMQDKK